MSTEPETDSKNKTPGIRADAAPQPTLMQSLRQARAFAKPYWTSKDDKWQKWGLLGGAVALNLAQVGLAVWFTNWNGTFYSALQDYKMPLVLKSLESFTAVAGVWIGVGVYTSYLQQKLKLKWRTWETHRRLEKWLGNDNHFRLQQASRLFASPDSASRPADNPDQRIANDVDSATSGIIDLGLGQLSNVVTIFSYSTMLWRMSAAAPLSVAGHAVPGYLFFAAAGYAAVGSKGMQAVGKALVKLYREQEKREGDFRFSLTRVREFGREIAQKATFSHEIKILKEKFRAIIGNQNKIISRNKGVNAFSSFYAQAAVIFPFVVLLKPYAGKLINLGGMMKTVDAFGVLQGAFSGFVNSYTDIAGLQANLARLDGFDKNLEQAAAGSSQGLQLVCKPAPAQALKITGLTLSRAADIPGQPDVAIIEKPVDLSIRSGDRVKISGPNGCGKSTLFLALQGLHSKSGGLAEFRENARIMCVPQRQYLPDLPLAEILTASGAGEPNKTRLEQSMADRLREVGLARLEPMLEEEKPHGAALMKRLSGGEQQRLILAGILVCKPHILMLDEAASALDGEFSRKYYALLREHLPDSAILNIDHQADYVPFHTRHLRFIDGGLIETPVQPIRLAPPTA